MGTLAPAYDLTFASPSHGYHSSACAGNYIDPGRKELPELTNEFSINKAKETIDKVKSVIDRWSKYVELFGASEASIRTKEMSL
ncbi:MAG: serine/threonine-protein kinase HipA, partial [Flavobacteriales bacterium]